MEWTGNIGRTAGHVLLALDIVSCALGIGGLFIGGLIVKDAADGSAPPGDDVGEVVEFLVLGGLSFTAGGTVAIVVALIVLGAARALRERLQRRLASNGLPGNAPASTSATPKAGTNP